MLHLEDTKLRDGTFEALPPSPQTPSESSPVGPPAGEQETSRLIIGVVGKCEHRDEPFLGNLWIVVTKPSAQSRGGP